MLFLKTKFFAPAWKPALCVWWQVFHSLPGPHPGRLLCKWVLGVSECAHVNGSLRGKEQTLGLDIRRAGGSVRRTHVSGTLAEETTHCKLQRTEEILFPPQLEAELPQFPEGTPPVPSPVSSGSWGICLPSFLGPKQGSSGRPRLCAARGPRLVAEF